MNMISEMKFLAYITWGTGIIYTIITTVSLDYISGIARAGQFFFGLLLTIPAGGVLYGLAYILSRRQDTSTSQE